MSLSHVANDSSFVGMMRTVPREMTIMRIAQGSPIKTPSAKTSFAAHVTAISEEASHVSGGVYYQITLATDNPGGVFLSGVPVRVRINGSREPPTRVE